MLNFLLALPGCFWCLRGKTGDPPEVTFPCFLRNVFQEKDVTITLVLILKNSLLMLFGNLGHMQNWTGSFFFFLNLEHVKCSWTSPCLSVINLAVPSTGPWPSFWVAGMLGTPVSPGTCMLGQPLRRPLDGAEKSGWGRGCPSYHWGNQSLSE